jgi:hypothetical protein
LKRLLSAAGCVLLATTLIASCKDDKGTPSTPDGAAMDAAASLDAGASDRSADATIDANTSEGGASSGLKACLDQPNELPRPPAGQLPCDLIPPGLTL